MMRRPSLQMENRLIGPVQRRTDRRGITLVECLMALVTLSMAVTAIAFAVTAGQMQAAESRTQSQAAMLAESLMDEILSKPYGVPTGGGQPARTAYTSTGQYNGFAEVPGNLRTAAGALFPAEFQRFGRSVQVSTATVNLPGLGLSTPGLNVVVTVADGGRSVATLTRFMVKPS